MASAFNMNEQEMMKIQQLFDDIPYQDRACSLGQHAMAVGVANQYIRDVMLARLTSAGWACGHRKNRFNNTYVIVILFHRA